MYIDKQFVKINVNLPKPLITDIDEYAHKEYTSRSDVIREAVRIYLHQIKTELYDTKREKSEACDGICA